MVDYTSDCFGVCYQIWFRNGGHCVERVEGGEEHEFREVVFCGNYEKCCDYIKEAKIRAAESIYC